MILAWLMNPNRVYPPDMTQPQREMLFIIVGHGWFAEHDIETASVFYKHKSGMVAKNVEEAYAMNQALIALER